MKDGTGRIEEIEENRKRDRRTHRPGIKQECKIYQESDRKANA